MPTWGRGGAGNIVTNAQIEEENKRIAADLEAQQSAAETFAAPSHHPSYPTTTTSQSQPQSQQYALSGRGGAGNWYLPRDLAETGTFVSTTTNPTSNNSLVPDPSALDPSTNNFDDPPRTSPNPPPTASIPAAAAFADVSTTGHRGRGGAGNYVWDGQREEEEKLKREKEERDHEAKVREKAERDVETGLARPGRAKLEPGSRVGRGEDGGEGEGWREWV
ncbi:hypothetical protein H2201_001670 [Coniosporium apollinis]|uniref:Uncharacterized protein n=1 Tax=Coniosporium apollinis TaxID=61459 RepID=A0ABQ9P0Y4_9PEZI|nr:hypothetical protein H2201_001670 [Coniosporium apollinis]